MSTEAEQKPKGFSPLLAIVAAVLILGVLAGGGWQAYRHSQWRAFRAEQAKIEAIVETWQGPPADANPVRWRAAWETVYNAVGNVCFSPEHVSTKEMVRLREDVEHQNQKPMTFESLAWLWSRLAQTGPHGEEYITRMQPLWEEVAAIPE